MPRIPLRILAGVIMAFSFKTATGLSADAFLPEPDAQPLASGQVYIDSLEPANTTGRGYKMIYWVDVPLDIFWRFKTDFDNDFLVTNKYIKAHRFVSRQQDTVITEDIYSNSPGLTFRWQTTVVPSSHRLIFTLLNPEECRQKYHFGTIELEAFGEKTKVTQIAYFDFLGVSFWVNYPFYGGMRDFLKHSSAWEQQTILKLQHRYVQKTDE
jgi:hypothetical protein